MNNRKTIFCDIDGTLIKSHGNLHRQVTCQPIILEGTIEKLVDWDRKGYNIILTTGRRESLRKITEVQLCDLGVFYDQLIMGIGGGFIIVPAMIYLLGMSTQVVIGTSLMQILFVSMYLFQKGSIF